MRPDISIAHPLVPISSPLTHMVYIIQFVSYLAGSKSVSARPIATMTSNALEPIASSGGKNESIEFAPVFD